MGKTAYHQFTGKIYFPFLVEPDEYKGNKFWAIKFQMNKKSREEYEKSGIACEINHLDRDDPDSPEVVRFKREFSRDFGEGEKELGRPEAVIWDNDRKEYVPFDLETTEIGNGTKAKVDVETFPTRKGQGHRLRGIAILDLVEFDREAHEAAKAEGSEEEYKPAPPSEDDLDDDMPF